MLVRADAVGRLHAPATMRTLDDLADLAARALARQESVLGQRPILAAVSGGADSTALAHALGRLHRARRLHGEPILVHADHGQADATYRAAAAAHTATLAWHYGLRFRLVHLDLSPGASEAAMRAARYESFETLARELGAGAVLTAHHADDDLETVLFRMLRGTGPHGLAGIPATRWLAPGLLLVRPFLGVRGEHLRDALRASATAWIEDPSNHDPDGNARAALRHELLPRLRERYGRRIEADLFAVARVARAAHEVVGAEAGRLLAERAATRARGAVVALDLSGLDRSLRAAAGRPLLEESLRLLHERLVGRAASTRWLARAAGLLERPTGRRLDGGGGVLAERTRDGLLLWAPSRLAPPPDEPVPLGLDDEAIPFGASGWRFAARVRSEVPREPAAEAGGACALLDAAGLRLPLRIRVARDDDRFRPLGSGAEVRLRGFLQRRGIPRFERARWPVVVDGRDDGHVLWVPGVEISETARLRARGSRTAATAPRGTRACLELRALGR